jgi:hypothetical protein
MAFRGEVMLMRVLQCCWCLLGLLSLAVPILAAETKVSPLGWTLEALDADDLAAIEAQLGKRAGVLIATVAPNSPAARAGCVPGEVLCFIAGQPVDSPGAVEKALAGKTGSVELVGFLIGDDEAVKVVKRSLTLPGAPPSLGVKPGATPAAVVPDAETQKKLKALEEAHKAGVLSDDEYARKKAELLKGAPAPPSQYDLARKGKTYAHVIGFTFWYPEGWSVKEVDEALQLVPAAAATLPTGQPGEVYFITGLPLEGTGIAAVTDPRVAAYLDEMVRTKLSAALQRTKAPAPVAMTNGQGQLMEWEARGEGGAIVARTYACVMKGYGVIFGACGVKEKVLGREGELTGIFASFAFEAGKLDPAVAGVWQLFSTRALRNDDTLNFTTDDPRRASSVSDEQVTLELHPDGTARRTSLYRLIAGGGAAGGSGKVWIDSGEQRTVKQGRWNAGNGTLFIMWADGAMDSWQYGLVQNGGVSLKLLSGARVQFWQQR